MPIVYKDVVQGSAEWIDMRCGIPTASQFHRIITPGGKPSKSAEMYRFELIAERILGVATDPYISHWMDRGSEFEEDAVAFYELQVECDTTKVGFVTNDAGTIGASPDRLVGEDGLLEVKVGKPSTHVGYLLRSGVAYEEHKIQAQAQLWVTGRQWNDLMAYNPALPAVIHRVERDEDFIGLIAAAVTAFSRQLEEDYALCLQKGYIVQPKPAPEKTMVEILKEELIKGKQLTNNQMVF